MAKSSEVKSRAVKTSRFIAINFKSCHQNVKTKNLCCKYLIKISYDYSYLLYLCKQRDLLLGIFKESIFGISDEVGIYMRLNCEILCWTFAIVLLLL